MPGNEDDETVELASSPCSLGDVDPAYAGLGAIEDVAAWRKAERKRLIGARMEIPADKREEWSQAICKRLEEQLGEIEGKVLSAYWPFRGEPDLKPLLRNLRDRGVMIALPVVVAKGEALIFREWRKDVKLARGVWNIPYPAEGEEVVPDIAIAPVVGFDAPCFRLGYGGGFFDRTMEKHGCRPCLIGVGYEMQAIPSILPQRHDIPMEMVITERRIHRPE